MGDDLDIPLWVLLIDYAKRTGIPPWDLDPNEIKELYAKIFRSRQTE